MELSIFLKDNVLPPLQEELILSDRFRDGEGKPAALLLRGISEEQSAALRRASLRRGDGGEPRFDRERYLKKLAAACVVCPDLRSETLQASWGVLGEEALLEKMLTAGEFARLLEAAQRVCGFGSFAERKDQLKKASAGETAN